MEFDRGRWRPAGVAGYAEPRLGLQMRDLARPGPFSLTPTPRTRQGDSSFTSAGDRYPEVWNCPFRKGDGILIHISASPLLQEF